jgi:hypothetical protein
MSGGASKQQAQRTRLALVRRPWLLNSTSHISTHVAEERAGNASHARRLTPGILRTTR